MKSYRKNLSVPRSPPTVMPILQQNHQHRQQPQPVPRLFLTRISSTSVDDVHYCSFWLALSHRSTQCPAIPVQIRTTLINSCKANLPSISRRSRWPQENTYCRPFTAEKKSFSAEHAAFNKRLKQSLHDHTTRRQADPS